MNKKISIKLIFNFKLLSATLFIILVFSLVGNIFLLNKMNNDLASSVETSNLADVLIKSVSAAEIYSEFVCGCCGKLLDPNNICCGDMRQKIEYINGLVGNDLSKDEIIRQTAKKFGLNSLVKEETKTKKAVRLNL